VTGTYNDALVWAYFKQKSEALELWHAHLDEKILMGRLVDHVGQAVDGKKQFEETMKLNMKLGPHSQSHTPQAAREPPSVQRNGGQHDSSIKHLYRDVRFPNHFLMMSRSAAAAAVWVFMGWPPEPARRKSPRQPFARPACQGRKGTPPSPMTLTSSGLSDH
jgi:hypothetical protein